MTAAEFISGLRLRMPGILADGQQDVAQGSLGFVGWGLIQPRVRRHHESSDRWYFVGDLHGDILAWHHLFERVRQTPEFRLCLIGDIVDRGPRSVECFAAVLEAALQYPGQVLWIKGNHDEGVHWSKADRQFVAATEPAEFVDWLNGPGGDMDRTAWGRLFVDVVQRLPVAVLFDDGLLAAHGGFPLADLWPNPTTIEAFHGWRAQADFVWGRCNPSMPRNAAHRMVEERQTSASRSGFGYQDFAGFCAAVAPVFPVSRFVRGHDHVADGFEEPAAYTETLLTLTACGFINEYGMTYYGVDGPYRRALSLARGRHDQLPAVESVEFPAGEVFAVYGEFSSAPPAGNVGVAAEVANVGKDR